MTTLAGAIAISLSLFDLDARMPNDAKALVTERMGQAGISVSWAKHGAITVYVLPLEHGHVLGHWAGDRVWLLAPELAVWGEDNLADAYAVVIIHELLHGLGCEHGKGIMASVNPSWEASDVGRVKACVWK